MCVKILMCLRINVFEKIEHTFSSKVYIIYKTRVIIFFLLTNKMHFKSIPEYSDE